MNNNFDMNDPFYNGQQGQYQQDPFLQNGPQSAPGGYAQPTPYNNMPYNRVEEIDMPPRTSKKSTIVVFSATISVVLVIAALMFGIEARDAVVYHSGNADIMVTIFRIVFFAAAVLTMIVMPALITVLLEEDNARKRRNCNVFSHGTFAGRKEIRHRRSRHSSFTSSMYYYTYLPKYKVNVNGRWQIRTVDLERGSDNSFPKEADFFVDPIGGDIIFASESRSMQSKTGIMTAVIIWVIVLSFFGFLLAYNVAGSQRSTRSEKQQTESSYVLPWQDPEYSDPRRMS